MAHTNYATIGKHRRRSRRGYKTQRNTAFLFFRSNITVRWNPLMDYVSTRFGKL